MHITQLWSDQAGQCLLVLCWRMYICINLVLGFVIGMLVNSIFCKLTDIYSVWSMVVFIVLFTIPFGILAFKYSDYIIIASSSLTGAYLVIRPISWLFGGFPNEFLLYHLVETNELDTLPWSFFGYLILIICLAIIGAMYQLLYCLHNVGSCTVKTLKTRFK